jgi:hypothetical protein
MRTSVEAKVGQQTSKRLLCVNAAMHCNKCSAGSDLPIKQVTGALGCLASTPALVVPLDGVSLEAAACNLRAGNLKASA